MAIYMFGEEETRLWVGGGEQLLPIHIDRIVARYSDGKGAGLG